MAMSYIQFPDPTPIFPTLPPLAWSVHKKTVMASRVTVGATGRESQLACAVYPRWEFTLTYGGNSWLREQTQNIVPDPTVAGFTELEAISGLFLACKGAYGEFYYEDPDDNSRLNQPAGNWNLATHTTTVFPLSFTWGSGPFSPAFSMPVMGINTLDAVYIGGNLQSSSIYTLDSTRTQLVLTGTPSNNGNIVVNFHFYFRCRFLDDHMDYNQFVQNLWEAREVRFESVKP